MSDVSIVAVPVDAVYPHPNADKLEVVHIGAYQTCETKGKYQIGDVVAHFPPDILIPVKIAEQLGVATYLKEAVYPGDAVKTKCRVGAIRLRSIASFGFTVKVDAEVGTDLTKRFNGVKYEPPEPLWYLKSGDNAKSDARFHSYTDIQNYRNSRYRGAMQYNLPVRFTEKTHGTQSRVGIIGGEFVCGSHHCVKKAPIEGENKTIYWKPLTDSMKDMLRCISEGSKNVIAFGEIYGSKVQFMDYGVFGSDGYALFDISVDGNYLDWEQVVYYATRFCISLVPLVYSGPFSEDLVERFVDGPTIIGNPIFMRSKFKGREGVVITPLTETYSDILGGRLILKAVSCDYLEQRKSDSH
jgi:RNA ligase (TIGR02306 family)